MKAAAANPSASLAPSSLPSSLKINSILVPTDFSTQSFEAIDTAISILSGNPSATLTLLAVAEPVPVLANPEDAPPVLDIERCVLLTRSELEELKKRYSARAPAMRILTRVHTGSPADTIVEEATRENFDLVVIASHGRSGFRRLLLGSVAEGVVDNARCPVLVTKARASSPGGLAGTDLLHGVKRIAVGYDERAGALKAVAMASAIARQCRAEMMMIHALQPSATEDPKTLREKALARLEVEKIPLDHISPDHSFVVRHGHPWEVIAEVAQECEVDLIVVGPHECEDRSLDFLGSAVQRLIRHASCAVLAVK